MKNIRRYAYITILITLLAVSACSDRQPQGDSASAPPSPSSGQIFLCGEQHGVEKIYNKEFELWYERYHNENMRHLFVEHPYYTAEFLNIWMQSDSDDILEEIIKDWDGTLSSNPYVRDFYKKIKSDCPATIFHGTDVGHQYDTTGERFLKYLKDHNLGDSEQYSLAQEAIEQGRYYIVHSDDVYRENKMAENFIFEYDKLSGENIMGIYGAAHTDPGAMDFMTSSVPCMANQLRTYYGDAVKSEDLTWLVKDIEPLRIDVINVSGKDYEASYFGKEDMTAWSEEYASREFWRLENAYDDLKNNPNAGDFLPYDNYPMVLVQGQVFVIDYTKTDGSIVRMYFRSDGKSWNGRPSTDQFTVK
jgi:hypothetical protein